MTLGVNAISVFKPRFASDRYRLGLPTIRPSSFFIRPSIKVPLPSFGVLGKDEKRMDENRYENDGEFGLSGNRYLNVTANIGGPLRSEKTKMQVKDTDSDEIVNQTVSEFGLRCIDPF